MLQTNNLHAIAKNNTHEDTSEIESFNHSGFYSELKKNLSDGLKNSNKIATSNNDLDINRSKEQNFTTTRN